MASQSRGLVGASLAAVSLVLSGCSEPAKVPTGYVTYNSKGGTFQCDVPDNWETKGGGTRGRPEWAKIFSGTALIHAKAGIVGSLLNDAVGGLIDPNAPPQFEPVHILHMEAMEVAKEDYSDYTELPGSPLVVKVSLGPARVSEFTAKGSRGVEIHGYRASIMGKNKMLTVFCTCRESEWTALKPSFDRALSTMNRGEVY